jgi:hypothetical protein
MVYIDSGNIRTDSTGRTKDGRVPVSDGTVVGSWWESLKVRA